MYRIKCKSFITLLTFCLRLSKPKFSIDLNLVTILAETGSVISKGKNAFLGRIRKYFLITLQKWFIYKLKILANEFAK